MGLCELRDLSRAGCERCACIHRWRRARGYVQAQPGLEARLAYTYVDAWDDATQARLIRRPRHTVDAELQEQLTEVWLAGLGLHALADRLDTAGPMPGYSTLRLFTSYAVTKRLNLKLRAENALNKVYQETYGYPALPRAVYGNAEWRF